MRRSAPLLAGVAVAASMPPWGWWPLGLAGLAAYGSLARRRRDEAPFATAFVFALGWFLPSTSWMWFLTAPGWLVAIALFAAMHGAAAVLAARVAPPDPAGHTAALVAAHCLAEALRLSWPFGGVPLATIAIGQASGPLARLAPIGGVVLIGLVATWLAFGRFRPGRLLVVAVLAFAVAPLLDSSREEGDLRVAVVQGGGEQGTHAVDTDPREPMERHLRATRSLLPDPVRDLVVWPENVVNVTGRGTFDTSRERTEIAREAARLDVPFLVGITEDSPDGGFTNAQVVVTPDGAVVDRYDKVRRVPFGEYVPFRGALASLGAPVDMVPRDAVAGGGRGRLDVPLVDGDARIAVAISWEVFFGGRVNEGVEDGATMVVNPTNGSSYTWSILQTQQLASSTLRAREQGRWVVQAAPTGFSAFVSPDGRTFDRVGIGEAGVIERSVPLREGRTAYSRLGNAPYLWALALSLALMAARTRGRVRRPSS